MKKSFRFGKNWQKFIRYYLDTNRVNKAIESITEFCGLPSLEGKRFIDIGCGSGLFSYAAYTLNASEIVSFDIDKDSVSCCEYLKSQAGNPTKWIIKQGSILDRQFTQPLGRFDIVYSWGVLHHTGDMWNAIENAAQLVNDKGLLYIAIYNKADGLAIYPDGRIGPSTFWAFEKKIYSSLPSFIQDGIDYLIMAILIIAYLLTFRNPVQTIKNHRQLRGMSWRVDIKDWLGGYPYEYANVMEIFLFLKKRGFSLQNIKSNNGLLNNEYLFIKEG